MNKILFHCKLLTPFEQIADGIVGIGSDGKITTVGTSTDIPKIEGEYIDMRGHTIIPGLINMHVHGGNGVAFGIGDLKAGLDVYSKWAAGNGVTGFVMTLTGPDADSISDTIRSYAEILENREIWPGSVPLGLHLEGPFLNVEKHGAYNPAWIREPSLQEAKRYVDAGKGWIKHLSMAPELENAEAVAAYLVSHGVVVSLAHSNTDYETAVKALEGDFTHTTHTFNCMSGLHHRAPGVVGAVLASDSCTTELIGDVAHVHPAAMKILYRSVGLERLVLITDAMPGAGLPEGKITFLGQEATMKDGVASLPDGSLGGSITTLDASLRALVNAADVPLIDAVRAATANPARVLGESEKMGSIEVGKLANFAIMNEQLEVTQTYVRGRLVFNIGS